MLPMVTFTLFMGVTAAHAALALRYGADSRVDDGRPNL